MKKINLNGVYRLYAYDNEHAPANPLDVQGEHIMANVPGNVELDYVAAGKLSDVFLHETRRQPKNWNGKTFGMSKNSHFRKRRKANCGCTLTAWTQ